MAKKKRPPQKKKKKAGKKQKQKHHGSENKTKEPEIVHQSLGTVLRRTSAFAAVTAGSFYLALYHVIGGNALWKLSVLAIFPLAYIASRQQFFQTDGFVSLIKPDAAKISLTLGALVAANGLGFLLMRFVIMGQPIDSMGTRIASGALFVLSPGLAFLIKLKAITWSGFAALGLVTQVAIVLAALSYYYGCVAVMKMEKDHLPAKKKAMFMLPV